MASVWCGTERCLSRESLRWVQHAHPNVGGSAWILWRRGGLFMDESAHAPSQYVKWESGLGADARYLPDTRFGVATHGSGWQTPGSQCGSRGRDWLPSRFWPRHRVWNPTQLTKGNHLVQGRTSFSRSSVIVAGEGGSRTHRGHRRVPANGFEAREAHRDLSSPMAVTRRLPPPRVSASLSWAARLLSDRPACRP